jgi:hypothetical protein
VIEKRGERASGTARDTRWGKEYFRCIGIEYFRDLKTFYLVCFLSIEHLVHAFG